MKHPLIARLSEAISAQEISDTETAIAEHLQHVWDDTNSLPHPQHLVRYVKASMAAMGAPKMCIRTSAQRIASRIRLADFQYHS